MISRGCDRDGPCEARRWRELSLRGDTTELMISKGGGPRWVRVGHVYMQARRPVANSRVGP